MSPTVESLKEIVRLAVFAAVGAILASLTESFTKFDQNTTTIVILAVLRFADKYIHSNKDIKFNGLVPF